MKNIAKIKWLFFPVLICWVGGHNLYVGLENRAPTEISCNSYLEYGSTAKWLKLSECSQTHLKVVGISKKIMGLSLDSDNEFYVPISNPNKPKAPTKLFLKVNSKKSKVIYTKYLKDQNKYKNVSEFIKGNREILNLVKATENSTISGLVQFGIDAGPKTRELLKSEAGGRDDFIIIDENASPWSLVIGILISIIGLLFLLIVLFAIKRSW